MPGWPRLARYSHAVAAVAFACTFVCVQGAARAAALDRAQATAQGAPVAPPATTKGGAQLYAETCAACHGADGKGRERSAVGFGVPLPDFTDCSFATREADADWLAVSHSGGPTRGFSTVMPAFGLALSESDILRAIGHIRTFCADTAWPRGELNLPRAFVTEKAFPEDEAVLTTSVAASGPGSFASRIVYEKRFGPRNQIEIIVPFETARGGANDTWRGGAGDLAVGFKRAVWHSLERGSIFAVAGELQIPTGDEAAGLSKTTPVFEPFVSFGQVLPAESFVQAQAGIELPFDRARAEREGFWRIAVGRTFTQGPFGRSWTPIVELAAVRELERGEPILWDIVPQVQVSLNTRQHVLLNVGARLPMNQRSGRHAQLLFYVLWDWFDGGLFDGW
jgi:mono/diheme cytochrome c family protein